MASVSSYGLSVGLNSMGHSAYDSIVSKVSRDLKVVWPSLQADIHKDFQACKVMVFFRVPGVFTLQWSIDYLYLEVVGVEESKRLLMDFSLPWLFSQCRLSFPLPVITSLISRRDPQMLPAIGGYHHGEVIVATSALLSGEVRLPVPLTEETMKFPPTAMEAKECIVESYTLEEVMGVMTGIPSFVLRHPSVSPSMKLIQETLEEFPHLRLLPSCQVFNPEGTFYSVMVDTGVGLSPLGDR